MSTDKSDAEILAEAREYIEAVGWTTGEFVDDEGHVCGLGGITISQGWFDVEMDLVHDERQHDMTRIAAKVLRVVGVEPSKETVPIAQLFTNWNDNRVHNVQEVLDAFAKAEKIERAGYDPDAA